LHITFPLSNTASNSNSTSASAAANAVSLVVADKEKAVAEAARLATAVAIVPSIQLIANMNYAPDKDTGTLSMLRYL